MKQFEIGVIIRALDRVTGPYQGMMAKVSQIGKKTEEIAEAQQKRYTKSMRAIYNDKGEFVRHETVLTEIKDKAKKEDESEERAHKRRFGLFGKRGEKEGEAHGEGHRKAHMRLTERLGEGFGLSEFANVIPEVAGITMGLAGVVEGYKKVTEASDAAARSQEKLSITLLHVKGETKESLASVMEAADKMEGKTTFSHKVFENAAAGFATFGMGSKQIKSMMPALADYLALKKGVNATDEDAVAAAKLLGKAYAGTATALTRQGIVLTAAQQAILKHGTAAQKTAVLIQAIEGRAGGLATKEANSPEGQAKRAAIAWEKVQEKIGQALTPIRLQLVKLFNWAIPYIEKFADAIPKFFSRISRVFKGFGGGANGIAKTFSGWVPIVLGFWQRLSDFWEEFAPKLADWFGSMWTAIQPALKNIAQALTKLWDEVLMPLWHSVLEPLLGFIVTKVVPVLVTEFAGELKKTVEYLAAIIKGIQGFGDALGDVIVKTDRLLGIGAGNNDGMKATHGAGSKAGDPGSIEKLARERKEHMAKAGPGLMKRTAMAAGEAASGKIDIHVHVPPGHRVTTATHGAAQLGVIAFH